MVVSEQTTRKRLNGSTLALALVLTQGCTIDASSSESVTAAVQEVVYGADDRLDYYAAEPPHQRLANSAIALIPGYAIRLGPNGTVELHSPTLSERYGVCDDERYADQPTASECSGVLLDDDLVLVAGHCFDDDDHCDKFAYVRGYLVGSTGISVQPEFVFGCKRIVTRKPFSADGGQLDLAVVQLDRSTGASLVAPNRTSPLLSAPVIGIGFPAGLPLKVDTGGVVLRPEYPTVNYFKASLDAFHGSSGTPVFSGDGTLAGVLIAGAPMDFEQVDGCARVRRVSVGPTTGEKVLKIGAVLDALCVSGVTRARLCGTSGSCGDGVCEAQEVDICVNDCTAPRCTGFDCLANDPPSSSGTDPASLASLGGATATSEQSTRTAQGCRFGPGVPPGSIAMVFGVSFLLALSRCRRQYQRRRVVVQWCDGAGHLSVSARQCLRERNVRL